MQTEAEALGLNSLSEYLRLLHAERREQKGRASGNGSRSRDYPEPREFHKTKLGRMVHGDSLGLLHGLLPAASVDLVMTSPPFGLVRKKSYGNEDADAYVEWFRPFAEGMRRVLKPKGSLVIDIGGAWKPGMPTRSLYHYDLLVMLCREFGFHLCEEHYWWNPSKLPTPAEWVNIRRVRVKDAVNCVWWLSLTPWPKADNRRVLAPYSESMEHLLVHGYTPKLRPSGHNISTKFQRNNGGAVPPNLIAAANTESNGRYQAYCKEHGLPQHPARFPAAVPEYFIRMLTDKGDLVVDPFAGSCVTGEVCEHLGRKWICGEISEEYLLGAKGRFINGASLRKNPREKPYEIYPPNCLPEGDSPLPTDGGEKRQPTGRGARQPATK